MALTATTTLGKLQHEVRHVQTFYDVQSASMQQSITQRLWTRFTDAIGDLDTPVGEEIKSSLLDRTKMADTIDMRRAILEDTRSIAAAIGQILFCNAITEEEIDQRQPSTNVDIRRMETQRPGDIYSVDNYGYPIDGPATQIEYEISNRFRLIGNGDFDVWGNERFTEEFSDSSVRGIKASERDRMLGHAVFKASGKRLDILGASVTSTVSVEERVVTLVKLIGGILRNLQPSAGPRFERLESKIHQYH